ncbi:hypothetical protein [Paenibacillus durus]|uniref:Uncharacterized protein n=1 Tax=Paenibacillus durus TaxID=44251 RepID=A0A089IXD4_PAEDU|nr:hypothetical protein [Paenibacillus durus]AIQ13619.1 hypothetical protein PDUR_18095 [Paenibacillus durus]
MGACKIDTEKVQRAFDEKFRMEDAQTVRRVLVEYDTLAADRLARGSGELVVLLADFQRAVNCAGLTLSERRAVSVAVNGGPTHWALDPVALDSAVEKITDVFVGWRYDSEYLTPANSAA